MWFLLGKEYKKISGRLQYTENSPKGKAEEVKNKKHQDAVTQQPRQWHDLKH